MRHPVLLLVLLVVTLGVWAAAPAPIQTFSGTHTIAAAMSAQDQPTKDFKVDINVGHGGGRWYANPVWIGLGVLVLLVLIVIAVVAGRGGGTTIVK